MQASELRELAQATRELANELEQAGFSNAASDLHSVANELECAADEREREDYDEREYQREQAERAYTCRACGANLSREGHARNCENAQD